MKKQSEEKYKRKYKGLRTMLAIGLAGALSLSLAGCDALSLGSKQPKAKSSTEAAQNCFSALQDGDF